MQENAWILTARRKKKDELIALSPTGLGEFIDCKLCGYRKAKGLATPRYKYPSLPNGVDIALHELSNLHRLKGKLPPLWARELPGRRLYHELPKKISWTWEEQGVRFGGTPDEWVLEPNGKLSVLDFKTHGFANKTEIFPSYQLQMSSYALLAEKAGGYPRISGKAYLVFFAPDIRDIQLTWHVEVVDLKAEPKAALDAIRLAAEIIRGPIPDPADDCKICAWLDKCAKFGAPSP